MYPRYKCLNCGRIWHSGEIVVVCPVCRSKPVKIKDWKKKNNAKS